MKGNTRDFAAAVASAIRRLRRRGEYSHLAQNAPAPADEALARQIVAFAPPTDDEVDAMFASMELQGTALEEAEADVERALGRLEKSRPPAPQ